jgi:low affinity Fe/Cu permease
MSLSKAFTKVSNLVSTWAGRPAAFIACMALVAGWAVSGPFFGFSDVWQLVINTTTTIITFLMVFLIQNTQNRDNAALHAKLDELIRVSDGENRFIGIEHLTDEELSVILDECEAHSSSLRKAPKPNVKPRPTKSQLAAAAKTARPRRAPRGAGR